MISLLLALAIQAAPAASLPDSARWARQAGAVTIVRDDWGIAHVHGRTDADAVFGMIYAQAEDDFNRIETNYLTALGRLAEAEGEPAIWQDLRMRLFIHPDSLRARYAASPAWLQRLMIAWADGLNYYLHTHPGTRPRVLTRFEPWMALSFTEGSIGGDVETISLEGLQAFYGDSIRQRGPAAGGPAGDGTAEPGGSNGFAIAPGNTVNHRALLLINPHTSFFFRSELQVTSDEGLNAYGAATWGQFFLYQGFNDRLGWMHTSTGADVIDEYLETIVRRNGQLSYRYGKGVRPVTSSRITVAYRTAAGRATRSFTVYRTHHGPVVRSVGGQWVTVALMVRPIEALSQSFLRTKARTLAAYRKAMALHANSSNNTVYADADGHIAYFHPQFIPRRDDRFDWTRPVNGSDTATEWHGLHTVGDSPHVVDPPGGWIQNTNDWPYSAAGPDSPRREAFPRYMDAVGESPRGRHAVMVLQGRKDFTPDRLRDAAFDSYLTAFAELLPPLLAAYDRLAPNDSLRRRLAAPIGVLRGWDRRWAAGSIPTALAVYWADTLAGSLSREAGAAGVPVYDYLVSRASAAQRLGALAAAVDRLTADFGTWRTPWGEINRFQRLTGDIVQPFSDAGPSIPVPFTSARWGSLASFGARTYPGTRRRYGTSGNSFVAVVEFGRDSVRAKAVTAGGESGDPRSPHFNDQAERYAGLRLRPVYFYPGQLVGHTEWRYRPGEAAGP
jgi:acyl-homoserine-lactone acylase